MDSSAGLTEPLEKGDIVQVVFVSKWRGRYAIVTEVGGGSIFTDFLDKTESGTWGNRDSLRLVAKAHD